MEYGAHLPLISFRGEKRSLNDLLEFTDTARALGYTFLCANDHMVARQPWLDGPTALAAVISHSGEMRLATTIVLPVVRGPAPAAKLLAALDVLSEGRLVVGAGPGSSARDYALVGLSFEERWLRLEESVNTLRAFFRGEEFEGAFYKTGGERLEPLPTQPGGPPIWLGVWGKKGGLRRTAALGDGWLASGLHTSREQFARSLAGLEEPLREAGRDPATFPNGIATFWTYVTDNTTEAAHYLENYPEAMRTQLPIGTAEECATKLRPYREAGAQRIFIWPIADETRQLRVFFEQVVPLIEQG